MRRYGTALMVLLLIAGCSGDKNSDGNAATAQTTQTNQATTGHEGHDHAAPKGQAAIPPPIVAADENAGVGIHPFFDEAGTSTEKTVSVGESFEVYVVASYPKPHSAAAAGFAMNLPIGLKKTGETKFLTTALTMGGLDTNVQIAFTCRASGNFYIMKYRFEVTDEFVGGEIETVGGTTARGLFIGFATCDVETPSLLSAQGGSIAVVLK